MKLIVIVLFSVLTFQVALCEPIRVLPQPRCVRIENVLYCAQGHIQKRDSELEQAFYSGYGKRSTGEYSPFI
ncbi:hypothetical protein FBUS_00774 [Fasciolopsis buskii]|uniref:Uncharacterized protein n=1 Tax=Fasciolopsis buskii TaxID=27845 RepID=A0A8E0VQ74_9TREM|nr:hypothetical protein FBUS_00774 [Fasciolopsis buski]